MRAARAEATAAAETAAAAQGLGSGAAAKTVEARNDSMVSLFGLWIEKRARLAGSGPALPQKGGATAGNARTYAAAEGERRSPGCRKDAPGARFLHSAA